MTQPIDLEALRLALSRMERDWPSEPFANLAATLRDEFGARFGDRQGDGCVRFKLAGLTAQSTAGLGAAMLTWQARARDVLARAERQVA